MKTALTEMNKLEGNNSTVDEGENQISYYEEAENTQSEQQNKTKKSKKMKMG